MKLLTGNDLPTGDVIWWTGEGWSRHIEDAVDVGVAGVEAGGQAIEDPPGVRSGGMGDLYLAYLRDPDGNKLCALKRMG